jgi:hypothetical protein
MQCFGGYMKVQELKENTPLKVVQVLRHYERPRFDHDEPRTIEEEEMVQMRIFTDGEIASESDIVTEDIDEYYFGKEKYKQYVDTLKSKNLCFKNHSFVITYTIAQEWTSVGRVHGWFDIIKDVSIYLENRKDRKALKRARHVIAQIENRNASVDYSSLYSMLFSKKYEPVEFNPEEIQENVYNVK